LTGTPIQNRLTNLASIFEFLKVYPFSDPKIFDAEITKPWFCGDQQGVLRLKTLVNYVTLCRTKCVVNLPRRFDQIHHLDFSSSEQEIYDPAKIRRADMLYDAIMSGSERSGLYSNALQWLNALRLICNHGVLESRRGQVLSEKEGDDDKEEWNERKAQAAFQEMLCAGAAICSNCTANLSESYESPGQDSSDLGPLRLLSCLQLLCDTCFQEKSEELCCPACPSDSRCSAIEVSVFEDAVACSPACSPGKSTVMLICQ
jgi:SWI/SNF-related matrix-associated actin-dependent regulator of chromatin subfamily A3